MISPINNHYDKVVMASQMKDIHYYWRLLKYIFIKIKCIAAGYNVGKYFLVGRYVKIDKRGFIAGDCIYIGNNSYIGPNVKLGNFCMISDYVNFIGREHVYNNPGTPTILAGRPPDQPDTTVCDDVWIGHNVTIMRGIELGEGCIVGANSVVTKSVPPYTIVAGIPAKEIKARFNIEDQHKHAEFLSRYRNGKLLLVHDRLPKFKKKPIGL